MPQDAEERSEESQEGEDGQEQLYPACPRWDSNPHALSGRGF